MKMLVVAIALLALAICARGAWAQGMVDDLFNKKRCHAEPGAISFQYNINGHAFTIPLEQGQYIILCNPK